MQRGIEQSPRSLFPSSHVSRSCVPSSHVSRSCVPKSQSCPQELCPQESVVSPGAMLPWAQAAVLPPQDSQHCWECVFSQADYTALLAPSPHYTPLPLLFWCLSPRETKLVQTLFPPERQKLPPPPFFLPLLGSG